jgi:thioredoxin-dependent peroxiredoxin
MTRIEVERALKPAVHFRTLTATARAAATGLTNIALGRVELSSDVQLRAGDLAPDFQLTASDGRQYRLSDFRGRRAVVVAWFPRAFTPGCTAECRSLGTNAAALRALSVQYFAASVDSPDTNAEFARSLQLPFPILSDETGKTARAYGVLSRSGFPSRWTFYIGVDGRILDVDRRVRTSTHGRDLAARLGELGIS